MHIIGGKYKGRLLATVPRMKKKIHLRPTSARARTVIFDLLMQGNKGNLVVGSRVLDLFAGTGSLGLEALSRGAVYAAFVEKSQLAKQVLNKNIMRVGVEDETAILSMDASQLLVNTSQTFSLVFVDPPYQSKLVVSAIRSAVKGKWIVPGSIVVTETPLPLQCPDILQIQTQRQVGLAWIGIFEVAALN